MNLFTNIWKDAKLFNATVYAQWAGILSVISCILLRLFWLIIIGFSTRPSHNEFPMKFAPLVMSLDMIMFPILILTIELPLIFRWKPPYIIAVFYYFFRSIADTMLLSADVARMYPHGSATWVLIITGLIKTPLIFLGLMRPFVSSEGNRIDFESPNLYSMRERTVFYMAYTVAYVFGAHGLPFGPPKGVRWFLITEPMRSWGLSSRWYLEPADIFSVVALICYCIAWFTNQEYVFSRTLGGPGVEIMTFVRPGRVPTDDSIAYEEGAIRL
ncbi:uncharacterized protein F4822DRAFT_430253 [Hypoxylon trugodes]|uniref:uncharacterized protein n=1 Tax=Hypoxylon trugodes TaxID=326681 RepID=UPI00219A7424|nr:uncharacterized protein F4822DRAFT_430253 [Hypoxylon trugodes]KAI1387505.1 hypothetical protein F4822DRAFT_430253 [Hypoxylon trugodes]